MPARPGITREAILDVAARVISATGETSITFQSLGEALGVSKQAIIYWFPSKSDLIRELIVPALHQEAEAVISALKRVKTAKRAIEVFLRALVGFHLADLGRFRLIYVTAQFDTQIWQIASEPSLAHSVHAATDQIYGALEVVLRSAPDFAEPRSARRVAVAVHMAGVGLLSMLSLADAVRDPMAHGPDALVDALVTLCTGQWSKTKAS